MVSDVMFERQSDTTLNADATRPIDVEGAQAKFVLVTLRSTLESMVDPSCVQPVGEPIFLNESVYQGVETHKHGHSTTYWQTYFFVKSVADKPYIVRCNAVATLADPLEHTASRLNEDNEFGGRLTMAVSEFALVRDPRRPSLDVSFSSVTGFIAAQRAQAVLAKLVDAANEPDRVHKRMNESFFPIEPNRGLVRKPGQPPRSFIPPSYIEPD